MNNILNIEPKEITRDTDDNTDVASFGFYDGIAIAKEMGLIQGVRFKQVIDKTHFIVCCGDVMIRVEPTDFPQIERRVI